MHEADHPASRPENVTALHCGVEAPAADTCNDVWKFGIAPQHVSALLREYGWTEREQVGPAEYVARYLEPAGRRMPVSEIERFVRAEKV